MLQLILGRSGSGKTEYVFSAIKALADSGEENILLITPEQFSFMAEKRLLTDLKEDGIGKVESTSFSRLAQQIRRLYGNDALPVLSKGAKAVLMKKAIESVQDSLALFHRNVTSLSFINSFISIYDEFKSCRVTTQAVLDAGDHCEKEILRRKLQDIALITDAYDALIAQRYDDPADELTRLYHRLLKLDYFQDRVVFIDGFSGFVAQEYKILEVILKQAKKVFITFCTDSAVSKGRYDLFSYVNSNINILRDVIKKIGVQELQPMMLTENRRAVNEELRLLEAGAFSHIKTVCSEKPAHLHLYCARNVSDECDHIAAEISGLLRRGYRAADITVVCRDLGKYEREFAYSFNKYSVPYFDDERQSIHSQPLILFVSFLLRCLLYSYRSEDIFSLLKTGMTALEDDKINALENYAYMWSVTGSKWKKEFTQSTKGFVPAVSESDAARIEALNRSREYVISRITAFQKRVKHADAVTFCKALYRALSEFSVETKLRELAVSLEKSGKSALAGEQGRIWDLLMDILDGIAQTGDDSVISVSEFYQRFRLMVTNEDLGTVPMGLDNVQVGSADRIRYTNPRAVFLAGANEGEFPQAILSSGLLSEGERVSLIKNDFKLYSYGEFLNAQEKYFAYSALTSASEQVYISYRGSGDNVSPSAIVREACAVFPLMEKEYSRDELTLERLESDANAFEVLAAHYETNHPFISSLKAYFRGKADYAGKLGALEALTENRDIAISTPALAEELFHRDMYLSASRIEDFYHCAFRYFCKFGLGVRPRAKAKLDPMQSGTVIHYVLEQLLRDKGTLADIGDGEIRILVNAYLTQYLNTQMGDTADFTPRFKYQFMRLSKMLVTVVERLKAEFEQSDFEARAFELRIGDGEAVPPKYLTLPDGGSIRIKGAIDRVDTYSENGVQYVRVVDYKTGPKEFSLCDILNGLNLQMFIYLFTLCASDHALSGVSSGVLYMHSSRNLFTLERNADINEQISKKENDLYLMKGVVLNDEEHPLAAHMEKRLEGRFIPAKESKEVLSGNLVTLEELGRLSKKIDTMITQMGVSLHRGEINQNPIFGTNHKTTCENCDYTDICMNRREIIQKEYQNLSFTDTLKQIKEETDGEMD